MLDKYYLKCKDNSIPVGILSIDIENDFYDFERNLDYIGSLPFFELFTDAPMPKDQQIKRWVLIRAPESNYTYIDDLIKRAGLSEYDPYGFFKYNNGAFNTDDFYVESIL